MKNIQLLTTSILGASLAAALMLQIISSTVKKKKEKVYLGKTSNLPHDISITEFELSNDNIDYFRRRVISLIDISEQLNLAALENTQNNIPESDPDSVILFELK